ncbi:MAG: hypothetical protein AAF357_07650, partial [Verrucomicrobiota bacterium]
MMSNFRDASSTRHPTCRSVLKAQGRGTAVAIFSSEDGPTGVAYLVEVGGQSLSFVYQDNAFIDQQTNSVWSFSGEAISGPLEGE